MSVETERQGSAVVFALDGSLTAEAGFCPLESVMRAVSGIDSGHLILDLGRVRCLDSCGVGVLVSLYNELRPRGVALTLVNMERHQKRLLEVAGLLGVFRVFDNRTQALVDRGGPGAAPASGAADGYGRSASRDAA